MQAGYSRQAAHYGVEAQCCLVILPFRQGDRTVLRPGDGERHRIVEGRCTQKAQPIIRHQRLYSPGAFAPNSASADFRKPGGQVRTSPSAGSPAAPLQAQAPTRRRYRVMFFLCVLSFLTYFDRVCIMRAQGDIQKDLGISDEQMGLVFGAFWLAYALFEVPGGWRGDR